MHKIIIGALIAIITWEIGAQLANRFSSKATTVALEARATSESQRTAPESRRAAPESRRAAPESQQKAREPRTDIRNDPKFKDYYEPTMTEAQKKRLDNIVAKALSHPNDFDKEYTIHDEIEIEANFASIYELDEHVDWQKVQTLPVDKNERQRGVAYYAPYTDNSVGSTTTAAKPTLADFKDLATQLMKVPAMNWDPLDNSAKPAGGNTLKDRIIADMDKLWRTTNSIQPRTSYNRDAGYQWALQNNNGYEEEKEKLLRQFKTELIEANRSEDEGVFKLGFYNLDLVRKIDTDHQYHYLIGHAAFQSPYNVSDLQTIVDERNKAIEDIHILADDKITVAEVQLLEFIEWRFARRLSHLGELCDSFCRWLGMVPKPERVDDVRIEIPDKVKEYWSELHDIAFDIRSVTYHLDSFQSWKWSDYGDN